MCMEKTALILLSLLLAACATAQDKADSNYEQAVREGNYSLIIVSPGGGGPEMAVLDREGDSFELAPEEGTEERSRMEGLSRKEAIKKADEWLPGSGLRLMAITTKDKFIVGYEAYSPRHMDPAYAPGPDEEAVLLPNLMKIEYGPDQRGKRRIKIRILPLKSP